MALTKSKLLGGVLIDVRVVSAKEVSKPSQGSINVIVEKDGKQAKIGLLGGTGAVDSFLKYGWEDSNGQMFSKIPEDKFKPEGKIEWINSEY
jgi:hypothetical protein